jgi:glycosyltransferase involved in cell wall biosynthesis
MPCFNHARYLEESIRSVLNQTERNLELIVIDNGSTDGSREIIETAVANDERLIAIYHPKNLGASVARNDGLKIARGEYIAFCDSDDIWLPEKLEKGLTLLDASPWADIAYGDARIIDGAGRETGALFSARFPVPGSGSGNLFSVLCVRNFINMQSALLRRGCLTKENYFDPDIRWVEDWLFWMRLARTRSFIYNPEPLCLYRVHAASSASAQPEGVLRNRIKVYLEALHFADLLPRSVAAEIFYHLGTGVSRLKEKEEEARRFNRYSTKRSYFSALRLNPFHWKAAARLIFSYARA